MSKFASALRALSVLAALTTPSAHAQVAPPPPPPVAIERPTLVAPAHAQQFTGSVSAGATLNGGNTKSFGATVGGRFQLIRKPHQLTAEALFTYLSARAADDNQVHPTATNVVGRARYDIFLSDNNALFAALAPRNDRFAGLDLRLQVQAGYLRNLYSPSSNHRLWAEVGYDGTYDNFSRFQPHGTPARDTRVNPWPEKDDFVHSARLFAGYINHLTPLATFNLGVEFLYDFEDKRNIRLSPTAEISSSISAHFKLSLLSRILFDNVPVDKTKDKTDYITTAQLVFTFDSVTPPPACPACDCSEEVAAAKSACKPTSSPADLSMAPIDEPTAPAVAPLAPPAPAHVQPAPAQPAPAAPSP